MIKKITFACALFSSIAYGSTKQVTTSSDYYLPQIPTFEQISVFTGDYFTTPVLSYIPYAADQIGHLVGNIFIYPFIHPSILEEEIRFSKIAMDPEASWISSNPLTREINAKFQRSYEQIVLEEFGFQTSCLVLESCEGNPDIPAYNLVFFTGNLSLAELSQELRPFARAALEEQALRDTPVIRLITVSARDMRKLSNGESYLPLFTETGYLHKNVLDKLIEKYGPINQVVAYSIGCAVTGQVMLAIEENPADKYPNRWWLHAGPSSLEEVSKNYWGGRAFLWPGAKLSGWDVDVVQSLEKYALSNISSFIGISGLVGSLDYYFPEKAGLSNHPKIRELVTSGAIAELVLLKPSTAESNLRSFHSLPLDYYDLVHVIDKETNDFLIAPLKKGEQANFPHNFFVQPGEHLARAILRSSLPK